MSKQVGKRKELDVRKLVMSKYEVYFPNDAHAHEFHVKFLGPCHTPYHGGIWNIHVTLPNEYPYKSPSIGFMNRIFHPNVDEMSGSVCLDVINQTWSPMFDLVNVFDAFLPQLLRYPNPADPLNGEAAAILLRNPELFNTKVKDSIKRYASTDFSFDEDSGGTDKEQVMEITPSSVDSASASMQPLSAPYNSGEVHNNSFSARSTVSSSPCSDNDSCLSTSWGTSPTSLCGFSISPFSSPTIQSVMTRQTSLEDFVKEGMDIIDDGASEISDMSDL